MKMQISRRGFVGVSAALSSMAAAPVRLDADDPLGVRKDFPATREYTYLNTAYIGLISQAVVDAAHDFTVR